MSSRLYAWKNMKAGRIPEKEAWQEQEEGKCLWEKTHSATQHPSNTACHL